MAQEKIFENKVKKYIEEQGGWQVKYFANRMTKSGIPDILACIKGHFLATEVKAEYGRPSELQKYHVKNINDAGGYAIILYPSQDVQFKQLIALLKNDKLALARLMVHQINERSK
jgi:Holliday junction resolvase